MGWFTAWVGVKVVLRFGRRLPATLVRRWQESQYRPC